MCPSRFVYGWPLAVLSNTESRRWRYGGCSAIGRIIRVCRDIPCAIRHWRIMLRLTYMLVAYPKSKKDDLTDKETAILREFVKEL